MINKHRLALALIASLGLIAFGIKNANAKSNWLAAKPSVVKPAKSVSVTDSTLKHLPKSIKNAQFRKVTKSNQKLHNRRNKAAIKSVTKHSHTLKDHHGDKADAKNLKKKHNSTSKTDNHKPLDHDNLVHVDNDPQNIDGMNQFSQRRHLYLYHAIGGNTRDLGGYVTSNHKYRIARDRIIRSADLDGLSESGLDDLKKLHVNKVIDLRYYVGRDGIQGHPDPSELRSKKLKGTGIDYQIAPVYSHTEAHQLSEYMKRHNEHGEYYYYGTLSVSNPRAIKTYRKVFSDLLNNKHGAILFHCNLGRDRTGVTSALILSALGVNRDVIFHDYLLTYHYHYHFSGTSKYPERAAELQYFFKTIDKKYGSVHAYLSQEIGLNHAKLMKLRKMYLVPNK